MAVSSTVRDKPTRETPAIEELDTKTVGRTLRALRKSKRITLSDLAPRVGRSVGFLSQVERGLSDPSIHDLQKLARALSVPTSWFFAHDAADPSDRGYVVRAKTRRRLGRSEDGLVEELLSPDLGGNFEVMLSVFEENAQSPGVIHRGIEEAGYIIEGRFNITIGGKPFKLDAGNSFRFTNEGLTWCNPGPGITRVLWVFSPPVY